MYNANEFLHELLRRYRQMEKEQRKELETLPEGQLTIRSSQGRVNYVQLIPASPGEKRIRRGITNNPPLLRSLARKKYLQRSLAILETNIPALEALLHVHQEPTPDAILRQLPHSLQALPPEFFLPEQRKKNQWATAEYEKDSSRPEQKSHVTSRGLRVRSKSEAIIAEHLDAHGIPYRYEQVLYIENRRFSPDFTIWRPDGLMFWEHCGLVNDSSYMKHHKWKLSIYERAGIVPWKNLIVTYDDDFGNLNIARIEAEITTRLL